LACVDAGLVGRSGVGARRGSAPAAAGLPKVAGPLLP